MPETPNTVLSSAWKLYRPQALSWVVLMALGLLAAGVVLEGCVRILSAFRPAADHTVACSPVIILFPPLFAACFLCFLWVGFSSVGLDVAAGRAIRGSVLVRRRDLANPFGIGVIGGVAYLLSMSLIMVLVVEPLLSLVVPRSTLLAPVPRTGLALVAALLALPGTVPQVLGLLHSLETGAEPEDALQFGWRALRRSPVRLSVELLMTALIAASSVVTVIGPFVTWPLVSVAWGVIYLRERGSDASAAAVIGSQLRPSPRESRGMPNAH